MWRFGVFGVAGALLGVQWGPVWVALAGGSGVGLTALATWVLGRRRESGSISTSQAETLWEAAEQIRVELREEVVARREEVVHLREELNTSRSEVVSLRTELADARAEIGRLHGMLMELPGE